MNYSQPSGATVSRVRIRRARAAVLLAALATGAALLFHQWPAASSSVLARPTQLLRITHHGPLGEADGAVPDGTSVFDDGIPGVARLDPALLAALRQAASAAADGGIRFVVDSGWRSPAYQRHLLHDAIAKYGSEEEAARWVATPGTSAHVSGHAVDIGPSEAAAWLAANGAAYGLCQIYGNEPWHYELRPGAAAGGCPPAYADPTRDPRMQR